MIKAFVKIGVGIGHTATGGKFPRKGHENRQCINDSDTWEPSDTEYVLQGMDSRMGRHSLRGHLACSQSGRRRECDMLEAERNKNSGGSGVSLARSVIQFF